MISHSNTIHSALTTVHCFANDSVGKQPVAWKERFSKYYLKELKENMDRYAGCHDITEILLKKPYRTINQSNDSHLLTGHNFDVNCSNLVKILIPLDLELNWSKVKVTIIFNNLAVGVCPAYTMSRH